MPKNPKPRIFTAPPVWGQLPASDAISARDGLRLRQTEDVLFLAQLLARAAGSEFIRETRDADGRWCYAPHDGSDAEGLPGFVKPAGIRRKLKQGFWRLRTMIGKRKISDTALSIDGRKIRDCARWAPGEPWNLGETLRWPFRKEADALMDSLHELPLMSDPSLNELAPGASVENGKIICPLDGIVSPIAGTIRTSPESWQMLCGREWRVILCPHCLGDFHQHITVMN